MGQQATFALSPFRGRSQAVSPAPPAPAQQQLFGLTVPDMQFPDLFTTSPVCLACRGKRRADLDPGGLGAHKKKPFNLTVTTVNFNS
jgi:hypothetical protein